MIRLVQLVMLVLGLIAAAQITFIAAPAWAQGRETSGLPLPRFVSLRSDEVNLRAGPGVRYPVEWIYNRRDLPVEVVAEFDVWRKIRDSQGVEGWVHQSMLAGRRMMVITGENRPLRSLDEPNAPLIAMVEPEVLGRLISCPRSKDYCKVEIRGNSGWVRRDDFWGVYPGEFFD